MFQPIFSNGSMEMPWARLPSSSCSGTHHMEKRERLARSSGSSSASRATHSMYLEFTAFVMNDLLPFRYTLPSRRWYVLASDELSEPAPVSVKPSTKPGLPAMTSAKHCSCCSGVPYSVMSLSAHRLPYT